MVAPLNTANKLPPFGEGEGDGEPLGLGLGEPDGETLGDGLGLTDGETLGLGLGEPLGETLGEGDGEPLGDTDGDGDGEPLGEPLGETDGDGLGVKIPNTPVTMLVVPCLTAIGVPLVAFGTLCPLLVSNSTKPKPLLIKICPTNVLPT